MSKFDFVTYSKNKYNKKKTEEEEEKTTKKTQQSNSFNFIQYSQQKSLGLDTLESDLKSLGKTVEEISNGWQTEETMKNTRSSVESMYDRLKAYQEYQKTYGGTDLTELSNTYKSVLDGWDDLSDYYGSYKSADEYKTALETDEKMKTDDLTVVQKEIDDLNKKYEEASKIKSQRDNLYNQLFIEYTSSGEKYDSDTAKEKAESDSRIVELDKQLAQYGNVDDLKKSITEKKAYKNKAQLKQDAIAMSSVSDKNSEHYDADYEKYVGIGAETPITEIEGNRYSGHHMENELLSADKRRAAIYALYEHNGGEVPEALKDNGSIDVFRNMTEEEFKDFQYWLGKDETEGTNNAQKYLDSIEESLNYREGKNMAKNIEGKLGQQLLFGVSAGVDQFVSGLYNLMDDRDYIPASATQQASRMIRNDLADTSGLAQVGYDLITTTSNMLPSILTSTAVGFINPVAGAVAGNILMGVSAAGNGYQEMLNLGYDKGQAGLYGTLVGVAEAGMQYALGGIGKLGGKFSGKAIKAFANGVDNAIGRFAIKYGMSMASEGLEEGLQEIINPVLENIALGYAKNTISDIDIGEVAYSAVLGALSAGLLEGGSIATSTFKENATAKKVGANIRTNAQVQGMLDTASLTPQESDAYNLYTHYANKGVNAENISDLQLGRLHGMAQADAMSTLQSKKSTVEQQETAKKTLNDLSAYNQENIKTMGKKDIQERYGEYTEEIIAEGLESGKDTESYKLAIELQNKLNDGQEITTEEIAQLVDANDSVYKAEIKTDAETRLTELGETTEVATVAEIITKKSRGEILSTAETEILENSEYGNRVYNEINYEEVADHAKTMDKEDTNLFISLYNGKQDVEAYANSFNLVKSYAQNRFTDDYILEHKGVLSGKQASAIYAQYATDKDNAQEQIIVDLKLKHKNAPKIYGKLDDSVIEYGKAKTEGKVRWEDLNGSQQRLISIIGGFGVENGIDVELITDGLERGINGAFEIQGNKILLDVYAGMDKTKGAPYRFITYENLIMPTFSHELTHWMKEKAPELYRKYEKYVIDTLKMSTGMTEKEILARRLGKMQTTHPDAVYSDAEVRDEVVARASEDMLARTETMQKFVDTLPNAEKKTFIEKVKEILQGIKEWFEKYIATNKSVAPEAEDIRKIPARIDTMIKMYDEMLVASIAANQALKHEGITGESIAEKVGKVEKNTTTEGDVKEQAREYDANGIEYWQIESNKDIFKNIKSTKGLKNAAYNYILRGDKGNKVIGLIDGQDLEFIRVSANEYVYGKQSQLLSQEEFKQKMRMSTSIIDLIENAAISYDAPDHKNHKLFPNGFKNYQGRVGIDNTIFRYIVRVGKAKNGTIFYDINLEVDGEVPRANRTSLLKKSTSNNSVRNSNKKVKENSDKNSDRDSEGNTLTKEQVEFFKDSKVRDENGNLKVMWHGTTAKFTVFDINKAGSNWGGDSRLGKGFYFANTKEEAFEWAKSTNAIKAYLNLVNPLDLTAPTPKNIAEEIDKYVEKILAKYDDKTYFITKEQYKENLQRIKDMYLKDASLFIDTFKYDDKGNMTDGIREFLSGLGYDGIIAKNETVAFYPEQVKETTNKKPTSNPDMRFADRDTIDYSRIQTMQIELNKIRATLEEMQNSEDFKAAHDKLSEAMDNGDIEKGIKIYKEWQETSGYAELSQRRDTLQLELENLRKSYSEGIANRKLEKEKKAIAESGLSEADYFRKQAVKEFGYTPYFYDAGYILPNGKMLNFSGEKGKHYGSRGQDHRAIGIIYANTSGTDALNRFVNDGNIRLMPESPGFDVSAHIEPTTEQYSTIRKFAYEYADNEYFSVDLTNENGTVKGTLEYEGKINPTRIINDIKHYYATGEIRSQSEIDKFRYADRDNIDIQTQINQSMTMAEAKDMIQRAFVLGGIQEWYDGEYKNGDEWLRAQGADEVALYIENEYILTEKYLNKLQGYIDDEFYCADILEAYLKGTLTGKEKPKAKRLDTSVDYRVNDKRFYSPQRIKDVKRLLNVASMRVTDKNRAEVSNARAKILLFAHNKGASELLGLTQTELNKKLRVWGGYPAGARETSKRFNNGVADSNKWTGIENCSWLYRSTVTTNELESLVKEIKGTASDYEKLYIARTMLALDTHIDWSWLSFDFDSYAGAQKKYNGTRKVLGFYSNDKREIVVARHSDAKDTVAHEMGHALDYQWARDFGYSYDALTNITRNTERITDADTKQFFDNFKIFIDSLTDNSDISSEYRQNHKEVFARFVAKFIQWVDNTGTGSHRYNAEYSSYKDNFKATHYIEFVKLLQEKAMLDAKRMVEGNVESVQYADRDYINAVENKDTDTLERLIEDAAEKAMPNSKVRDGNGKLLKVYHGRVSEFNVFDRSFSNIEGDFGKGYYFTSNEYDVDENYASEEGPDLKNKIARYAEQLEWQDKYADLSDKEREEIARQHFITSEPSVITAYLNMENPVYITPNEKGTFLDFNEEYDEENDEYGEPEGLLVDFIEALSNNAYDYSHFGNVDFSFLYEEAYDGGLYAADAVQKIKNRIIDELADEEGNIAISEIIRLAFEEIGFDGIIDTSVYYKFRNMNGMDSSTTHYIVFNSEQIKEADLVTYDDNGEVIPLSERFNLTNEDMRYADRDNPNIDKYGFRQDNVSRANNEGDFINEFYYALSKGEWRTFYSELSRRGYTATTDIGVVAPIVVGDKLVIAERKYTTSPEKHDYIVIDAFKLLNKDGDYFTLHLLQEALSKGDIDYDTRKIYEFVNGINRTYGTTELLTAYNRSNSRYDITLDNSKQSYSGKEIYEDSREEIAGRKISFGDKQSLQENDELLKFSDRDNVSVYDKMGETDRLIKENQKLIEDVERLKERLKIERQVTHGNYLNLNQLGAVAGHLRNISNSNYSKTDLIKELEELYLYISHSEELSWDDMFSKAYDIASRMIDEAKPDIEVNDYAKRILKDIRSTRITINEGQKQNAIYKFGKNYRNSFMGKVTIVNSGTSLDRQWKTWSKDYPDFFDESVSDADQLVELYNIYDDLRDISEVVVEYDTEERTRWLAREIYNQFWNVSPVRTVADKYDKQIKLLNFEHRRTMQEFRDDYNARLKKQHTEDREKFKKLAKEIRERKDKEIAEIKKLSRERMDAYKENAERKTKIQSITQNALTLNTWLTKNSKDEHIHEAMKGPVITLLNAIDFSSKRLLDKNIPTQKDISLAKALSKVKDMMKDATMGKEGLIELYGHDMGEEVANLVEGAEDLVNSFGDNELVLSKMSLEQLKSLDKLVKLIKQTVTKMNKFHVVHHKQGIANLSDKGIEHLDKLGDAIEHSGIRGRLEKMLKWTNATPYYAFKRLGETGIKVFEALQDGWDKLAFNVRAVTDFTNDTYTSKEVREWSKETKTFTLDQPDGKKRTFEMPIAQIMALHCVSKQEDAIRHLLSGGMTLASFEKNGKVVKTKRNLVLTMGDIQTITDTLSNRQLEVANKLQEFMNTVCANWGNEVSMQRFAVMMFTTPNYFPIKVTPSSITKEDPQDVQDISLFRLLNMSFTKSRNEFANQSIEIGNIFDVFAQHSSDMAKYNALALPVLDAYRWYSYKGKTDKGIEYSTYSSLENALGGDSVSYFNRFLKDLNGSQNVSRDNFSTNFFRNAKIAAVANNLRVVFLQPTAYVRASAVIKDRYLTKAFLHKPKIAKAEKYCGMALWKSMGYYDVNISKGVADKIKHAETWRDKAIDWSMKGAEVADKLTFGYLWNACELEIRAERKDLKVGSEEFYNAIAKRLREVIYATQVVDSTMTRSHIMRSADKFDKVLTAFMSEPTLSYNMVADAFINRTLDKRANKKVSAESRKYMARVLIAYTTTNMLTALIASAFEMFRDDEDEELEASDFWIAYFKNLALDMSITGKLPYIKDLVSVVQGYSASRTDAQWMTHLFSAGKAWYKIISGDGEGQGVKAFKNTLRTFSDISGLAFFNVYRDLMAALNKLDILTAEELEELIDELFGY